MAGRGRRTDRIDLEEVHRFPNGVVEADGHLRWDITGLFGEVARRPRTGLAARPRGRVDRHRHLGGRLRPPRPRRGPCSADPIAYRDDRTAAVIDDVHAAGPARRALRRQRPAVPAVHHLYQLAAEQRGPALGRRGSRRAAPRPPGLLADRRAPHRGDQRLDHRPARRPHRPLVDRSARPARRCPPAVLPPIDAPGHRRRPLPPDSPSARLPPTWSPSARTTPPRRSSACPPTDRALRLHRLRHVVARRRRARRPRRSPPEARAANFTNEGGVDGRIRFLRNVGGLWLLQESHAHLGRRARPRPRALAEAAELPRRWAGDRRRRPRLHPARRHAGRASRAAAGDPSQPATPSHSPAASLDSLAPALRPRPWRPPAASRSARST